MTNWVEQRRRRDENLGRADELWREVLANIKDCCTSLNSYYSNVAKVKLHDQGNSLVVAIDEPKYGQRKAVVFFEFLSTPPRFRAKVEQDGVNTITDCEIDADEKDLFILHKGQPISPDEFSKIILKPILFKS